jgi:hypothetical protein
VSDGAQDAPLGHHVCIEDMAMRIHDMSTGLCGFIDELKTFIRTNTDNDLNYEIPTAYLCGTDPQGTTGKGAQLQQKITAFRDSLKAATVSARSLTSFISRMLATDVPASPDRQAVPWNFHQFYNVPASATLNTLTRIGANVRVCSLRVMEWLLQPEQNLE